MATNVTNLNGVPVDGAQSNVGIEQITEQVKYQEDDAQANSAKVLPGGPSADAEFIRQGFSLPRERRVNGTTKVNRDASVADPMDRQALRSNEGKFEDTSLGGWKAINPIPQITRYADVKKRSQAPDSRGTGRYYQEAYTANAQIIHMRFGVPEYNSLNNFLADMYDPSAGKLARTGEGQGFIASVVGAVAFVVSIPIRAISFLVKEATSLLFDIPYNRFYYSKPAMPSYYSAVNTMLTKIAINMKLIDGGEVDESADPGDSKAFTLHHGISLAQRQQLHDMMPDIFNVETGFDIYRIAHKYQRLANQQDTAIAKAQNAIADGADVDETINNYLNTPIVNSSSTPDTILKYQEAYFNSGLSGKGLDDPKAEEASAPGEEGIGDAIEEAMRKGGEQVLDVVRDIGAWFEATGTVDMLNAETLGGSQWVNFKVDSTGSMTESFSNSAQDSSLGSSLNGASSSARSTKFNMAGGNISDGPLGTMAEWVTSTAGSIAGSLGNAVGLQGLGVALGGGMVDIPKFWENSDSTTSKGDYTIKLRTPYGNKISIFKDLYIPMCMLLGAALPLSTGSNTYTSPFLVELFDQGRVQTRLGMIDNLSINRGVGNLGWSVDGLPLGIDISFSVMDLTNVLHMPISGESLSFNDQSKYQDYMALLGGLGTLEQLTVMSRFKRKKLALTTAFSQATSISNLTRQFADTVVGRAISGIRKNGVIIDDNA